MLPHLNNQNYTVSNNPEILGFLVSGITSSKDNSDKRETAWTLKINLDEETMTWRGSVGHPRLQK